MRIFDCALPIVLLSIIGVRVVARRRKAGLRDDRYGGNHQDRCKHAEDRPQMPLPKTAAYTPYGLYERFERVDHDR